MPHEVRLPELGMGDVQIVAGRWHVQKGSQIIEGDRLLEVQAGSAGIDIPSPVSGRLTRTLVEPDDWLKPGQRLAMIEPDTLG